jgi:hypothetical protein
MREICNYRNLNYLNKSFIICLVIIENLMEKIISSHLNLSISFLRFVESAPVKR